MGINESVTKNIWIGLRFGIGCLVLCGGLYTAVITFVGEQLFPHQARGSVIVHDGQAVGSTLVAQAFADPRYFYARPSAAGYDPTATGGSNLAPSNPELRVQARARSEQIQSKEQVIAAAIPVELIAASGAGLDPHISPDAALFQAERVAAKRNLTNESVTALIAQYTEKKQFGVFGQPRVNVLKLNLALDQMKDK